MNAFHTLTSLPLFGILLCLLAYVAACRIRRATGSVAANPFLIAAILVVAVLLIFRIPYQDFNQGGQFINFFLSPITVILAVPLYKHRNLLNHYLKAIVAGHRRRRSGGDDQRDRFLAAHGTGQRPGTLTGFQVHHHPYRHRDHPLHRGGRRHHHPGHHPLRHLRSDHRSGGIPLHRYPASGSARHRFGLGLARHRHFEAIEMGEQQGAISGLTIGIAGITTVLVVLVLNGFPVGLISTTLPATRGRSIPEKPKSTTGIPSLFPAPTASKRSVPTPVSCT